MVEWLRPLYSCAGNTISAGSSLSTPWNRLSCNAAASPLGKSVRPVAPINSVSPVKTRSSRHRHMESLVCPGVYNDCRRRRPTTNKSPPSRRRTRAVHDDRRVELIRELPRRGEMISMRMRVDEITKAQTMTRRQCDVAVDLAELGINQRCGAGFLAADQVGAATPAGNGLKYHERS